MADHDEDVNYINNHDSSLILTSHGECTPAAAADSSPPKMLGRHSAFCGVRCRSGKWVSEIREPRKTTRIWLGTYAAPEMAAAAYDVAALALKGPEAQINFPALAPSYPTPASLSSFDIRAAAANVAAAVAPAEANPTPPSQQNEVFTSSAAAREFIDEEALFDMLKLLVDMAEGMIVSPPMMKIPMDEDELSPENYSTNDRLWSYSSF